MCYFPSLSHAISSTYLSIYYYSLDLVCFQPTSVLMAPCRLFECPKTLAGLCSSHPAALNGLSLHQLPTGLHKYTHEKSCQSAVNGANIQACHKSPLISNHTAYTAFSNGLTNRTKPLSIPS